MKKSLSYILLTLILIIGFPIISFALSYNTEIIGIEENMPNTSFGKINLNNNTILGYKAYGLSDKPAYQLSGTINNSFDVDIDYELHLILYDGADNYLGEIVNNEQLKANNKKRYNILVASTANLGFDFKMIQKYKLSINILTDVERGESVVNDDYYFSNYNVVVNVSSDNIYSINESFVANFKKYVNPIKKDIPTRYIYNRDLSSINKKAIISNMVVGDYYTDLLVKGNREYTIGEANSNENVKEYNIKYDYNVGKDTINKNDEFMYWLNNTWNEKIDGINFEINLPKEVDDLNVILIDQNGYEVDDDFTYDIEGTKITGCLDKMVSGDSVYGIKIVLPDNYFVGASNNISVITIVSLIVPLVSILISILIWYLLTNTKTVKNTSMYPYKRLNSLNISYLYNGKVKERDIGTILFNLCNDGYIEIVKNKESYMIVKKDNYKKNNEIEKIFMNELFKYTDQVDREQLGVAMRNMKDRITIRQDTKQNRKKLFVNELFSVKVIFWLLIIAIFVTITINSLYDYQLNYLWINLLVSGVGYILLLKAVPSRTNFMEKIIISLISLVLIASAAVFTSVDALRLNSFNLIIYIIGIICMIIIAYVSNLLPNRTSYGRKILNTIKSYKNYLLTVSEDRLKEEMINNKNYFYDIIPYALVLGIIDKWYNRFTNIELVKPNWYLSDEKTFDKDKFFSTVKEIYSDMYFSFKR